MKNKFLLAVVVYNAFIDFLRTEQYIFHSVSLIGFNRQRRKFSCKF